MANRQPLIMSALVAMLGVGAALPAINREDTPPPITAPAPQSDAPKPPENLDEKLGMLGKRADESQYRIANLKSGNIYPVYFDDFRLKDLQGNVHVFSDYFKSNKPIIINFWETWCGYCPPEMKTIAEFEKQYKNKVNVLTLTRDENKDTRQYATNNNLTLPILMDETGEVFSLYSVSSIPRTLIIDPVTKTGYALVGATDYMNPDGPVRSAIDMILGNGKRKQPKTYTTKIIA